MDIMNSIFVVCSPYFNIIRILTRKYGVYLTFGLVLLCFQGFSGYYILRYGIDENVGRAPEHIKDKRSILSKGSSNDLYGNNENYHLSQKLKSISSKESLSSKYQNYFGGVHNKGPIKEPSTKSRIQTPCNITSTEAISAIHRAKTEHCKNLIANITCQINAGVFYAERLNSLCPSVDSVRGKYMGCYIDTIKDRLLKGFMVTLKRNSPTICSDLCFQRGYFYSGVEFEKECFCGNEELPTKSRVEDSDCDMKCLGDPMYNNCGGFLRISIIQTGHAIMIPNALRSPKDSSSNTVRVAFLLTLNGRALRQVHRLIKILYHRDHYFFIHIDSRQHFLYRELLKLEDLYPNIRLSRRRLSSIWGGASLLTVLLHCMRELLSMSEWKWDFVLNLSESDFPIKTNIELVKFLTANQDRNFLKSHGENTNKFLQKQGLDRTFLECETHMWRIGERKLPLGIRIDGGSDWICLNRQFVEYVIHSEDDLVTGLKKVFSYTLLPAESFFHTVLRNSAYCQTFCDNNLHVTNWKRKLGCRCQYKNIVDWCGCSPNDFTLSDWNKLEASKSRNLFFARKFEPVVNMKVINRVEQWLYGSYTLETPGLNSYWENKYDSEDSESSKKDVDLTFYNSAMRLSINKLELESNCRFEPTLVVRAHSYHLYDKPKGVLIEFSTHSETSFEIEVWLKQKGHSTEFPISVGSKTLMDMQVNTDFDLKEQIFRNFGGILGPENEITITTWWIDDADAEAKRTNVKTIDDVPSIHPLIVLLDPFGVVAGDAAISVDKKVQIVPHTFDLAKPLHPGDWLALLVLDGSLLAKVAFSILPLQFHKGKPISVQGTRELHTGPRKPYKAIDISSYSKFLPPKKNLSAVEAAKELSLSYGYHLSQWIDQLVKRFYSIEGLCYSPGAAPPCLHDSILPCSASAWSSHSPDPKSKMADIDVNTGSMNKPYLIPPPAKS